MQNKKSQVEDMLAYLLVVLVLFSGFLYYFVSNLNKEEKLQQQVKKSILNRDSSDLVLNYLRSPLDSIDGVNIADSLNNYFVNYDSSVLEQIKIKANKFFSKSDLETEYSTWSLVVTYNFKELVIESDKPKEGFIERREISKVDIPTGYTDKVIEVTLFTKQKNTLNENVPS